jgi:Domain of unknown function (DUF4266)
LNEQDEKMHEKLRVALCLALAVPAVTLGCATVRPEQRAILADRIMQFGADARERAALEHAIENREGSNGAGSVQGGGCGCN